MKIVPSSKIYTAPSKIKDAGLGVFSSQIIKEGDIIERCPVILIPEVQVTTIRQTILHNYYFMWGDDETYHRAGICLGFGSLYNHSYTPNGTYTKDYANKRIDFIAIKDIAINEEITVNYNYGNPNDKSELWIQDIPPFHE